MTLRTLFYFPYQKVSILPQAGKQFVHTVVFSTTVVSLLKRAGETTT